MSGLHDGTMGARTALTAEKPIALPEKYTSSKVSPELCCAIVRRHKAVGTGSNSSPNVMLRARRPASSGSNTRALRAPARVGTRHWL